MAADTSWRDRDNRILAERRARAKAEARAKSYDGPVVHPWPAEGSM